MKRKINPNFIFLNKSIIREKKRGVVLEGSSRSGKTWSIIDFLIMYIARYKTGLTINILRETYNSFKTTLYEDFKRRLPVYGLLNPFSDDIKEITTFNILGSKINLIGGDKPSKYLGAGSDIVWMNEAIHVSREIFDQAEMRCRGFFIMDYNPSFEEHWIYDAIVTRDDVNYFQSTFVMNPFISDQERKKILSYDPDNPENIRQGTADKYNWEVYGLGLRASPKGLIFPYWYEYEELPGELYQMFTIDWGGNDPTALCEINPDGSNLYIKEHIYEPQILNSKLIEYLRKVNTRNSLIICDSARKDKIYELQMAGLPAYGATKGEGSIIDGIDRMKDFRIFVHKDSKNVQKEFRTYKWAVDRTTGKPLNVPEDKNNHCIDGIRYGVRYYRNNIRPL